MKKFKFKFVKKCFEILFYFILSKWKLTLDYSIQMREGLEDAINSSFNKYVKKIKYQLQ
jgi:hypothetical protein